jgi:hypothetical protein
MPTISLNDAEWATVMPQSTAEVLHQFRAVAGVHDFIVL